MPGMSVKGWVQAGRSPVLVLISEMRGSDEDVVIEWYADSEG